MTIDPRGRSRVLINGNGYPFDHHGFARTPVPRRDLVDTGSEQTDRSLDDPSMWRRGQRDFRGGMNQIGFDREDSDRTRFSQCFNMVATDEGLRTAASLYEVNSAGPERLVTAYTRHGGSTPIVYALDGSTGSIIYSTDSPDFGTWSTVSGTSTWSTYDMVFGFDEELIAVHYSSPNWLLVKGPIASTTTPSAFATASETIRHLLFSGGRLFGAGFNDPNSGDDGSSHLYEYDSAGTETLVWTVEGTKIEKMSEAPGGIYIAANNHSNGTVYLSVVSPVDGGMSDPVQAMALPVGEYITDIKFSTGVLVVGTTYGLRIAVPDANGFLTYGPLNGGSRNDGTLNAAPVKSVYVYRDRVLALITSFGAPGSPNVVPEWNAPHPDGTVSQNVVIEADLSNFVDTLQPAVWVRYYDPSGGISSANMVSVDGIPMVCGYEISVDAELQGQTDPWPSSRPPFFSTGFIDFTTIENKNLTMLELSCRTASTSATGWTARAYYRLTGGDTTWTSLGDVTIDSTSVTQFDLQWDLSALANTKRIEFGFRFTASTGGAGAEALTVTQWSCRGAPVSFVPERIRLPLVIYEAVEVDGLEVGLDPSDVWAELHALMQSRAYVDLTMGGRTEKVYVEAVSVLPDQATNAPLGWDSEKTWLQATWLVDLVTVETV